MGQLVRDLLYGIRAFRVSGKLYCIPTILFNVVNFMILQVMARKLFVLVMVAIIPNSAGKAVISALVALAWSVYVYRMNPFRVVWFSFGNYSIDILNRSEQMCSAV